jgi:hypothetical protein
MYFKNNNSRHLYGEAFDIVNASGQDFQKIMTDYVLKDMEILSTMWKYGVSACIETTQDDSGVQTKHYHFGSDPEIANNFWMNTVRAANPEAYSQLGVSSLGLNAGRRSYYQTEITNVTV